MLSINDTENGNVAATGSSNSEDNSAKNEVNVAVESKEAKKDTLSDYNSSCKFNFIFYFIYKVKYDENGEIDSATLNFDF